MTARSTGADHWENETHHDLVRTGNNSSESQTRGVTQGPRGLAGNNSDTGQMRFVAQGPSAGVGHNVGPVSMKAIEPPEPMELAPLLADPMLTLLADMLDDLERTKNASANRLRQLTRDQDDSDGINRGFGLTLDHPLVAQVAALVGELGAMEHQAILMLQRAVRKHPLGSWIKQTAGVGEKQGARLLAAVGDPYWNTLHDRPRTVSELRSYCGFGDAKTQVRRRGQKSNWSATAKTRAYLIADKCVQTTGTCGRRRSPYRDVYDKARAAYLLAQHSEPCVRCGPKGKPALPGSDLSDGHKHARALRLVAKEVLKDLWQESKALHEATA